MTDFFGGAMMQSHRTGQPTGTANRRKASTKGEVNMNTPNAVELLVKEAKSTERLEIMAMAEKAQTIEDFRKALEERHNASK